jgi:hypothetical protein
MRQLLRSGAARSGPRSWRFRGFRGTLAVAIRLLPRTKATASETRPAKMAPASGNEIRHAVCLSARREGAGAYAGAITGPEHAPLTEPDQ